MKDGKSWEDALRTHMYMPEYAARHFEALDRGPEQARIYGAALMPCGCRFQDLFDQPYKLTTLDT